MINKKIFCIGLMVLGLGLNGCSGGEEDTVTSSSEAVSNETAQPSQTVGDTTQQSTQTSDESISQQNDTAIDAQTTVVTTNGKKVIVYKTKNGLIIKGEEGKIVLLEVYGWTCPHCIAAIDGYNRIKAKYPNDVYILTIESYGTIDNAGMQQYVAEHHITYDTVAKENAGTIFQFVRSLTGYAPEMYGVPALLVFDKNGKLAEYFPPQDLPEQQVVDLIEGLK